jgi:hypothetical protein
MIRRPVRFVAILEWSSKWKNAVEDRWESLPQISFHSISYGEKPRLGQRKRGIMPGKAAKRCSEPTSLSQNCYRRLQSFIICS